MKKRELNPIEKARVKRGGICKGCGRTPASCWVMPCLVLELALEGGVRAINRWCRESGAEFRVERKRRGAR